jgi:hypothetical protein
MGELPMRSKSMCADCGRRVWQYLRTPMTICMLALGLSVLLAPASDVDAAASDDAFVAGYATAVLSATSIYIPLPCR